MFSPAPRRADPDAAIRSTDDDAAHSRLSAVRKGYLIDPYIELLIPRAHLVPSKPPLINIGTFLRSRAIDTLVQNWIKRQPDSQSVQIISLGAGTDTRYWRLWESPLRDRISKYVEVDFPEVTGRKAMTILKNASLRDALGRDPRIERGGTMLSSPAYHLIPADLRVDFDDLCAALLSVMSVNIPVLVVAECIFPYMEPSISSTIIGWFATTFLDVGVVIYEMFGLEDSFGKVMRANMRERSVELPGAYPTLESHQQRFLSLGFASAEGITLKNVRTSHISSSERERISHLEWLDELEEMELVLRHYIISWGWREQTPYLIRWGL
ncbi:carboxy methyl transferase for protein phosphatase 2A [Tulasnella sp. 331]|nr:carboxy methyl transferase for protein phosphatase 2A [Tulasnella sp. 331]